MGKMLRVLKIKISGYNPMIYTHTVKVGYKKLGYNEIVAGIKLVCWSGQAPIYFYSK